ncbi:HEPN domain-containing protein [Comamonas sediminis]|uniref:HEPN domain-containing protein n=1 Tax=Comamonas sediminis TaxID=1783360 RepID=UPI0034E4B9CB
MQVDVIAGWKWLHFDTALAKKTLDQLISRRGDVVHRSKPVTAGAPVPHRVKRDDLEKAIRFLTGLVTATEHALEGE